VGLDVETGDNTALVDSVTIQQNAILDGGFETPAISSTSFQYAPADANWQFAGTAGVASNDSGFTVGNPSAPEGSQVAFLQETGSMSQAVSLGPGTYSLSFMAAQRAGNSQQIEVLFDGTQVVGEYTPTGTEYAFYQTGNFTVATAGTHTISLLGIDPGGGDNTALVDSVALQQNPIQDGGFETPALTGGTFLYGAAGAAWQFAGTAGVASNGSGFTVGNPSAPDGTQVAFLQETGSMSQSVYFAPGTYSISFMAAQRSGNSQQIKVLVDDTQVVGDYTPTGTQYTLFQTGNFTIATAGIHTISLVGLDLETGDNTALVDSVSLQQNPVLDGGFETPALTSTTFQYAPGGTDWLFAGTAGVASNGSGFTSGNPNAPNGSQVAFLQGANSSISQSITLAAGSYTLSFEAAQRGNMASQNQQIEVLIDGTQQGATITPSSTEYSSYQVTFTVTGSSPHTLTLEGISTGDNTALVDSVTIQADFPS
jgi:hypothetical protein